MKDDNKGRTKEATTVQVLGASVPDQIQGKWFPEGRVKKGTRWFYVLLLGFVLLGVVAYIIYDIKLIFS